MDNIIYGFQLGLGICLALFIVWVIGFFIGISLDKSYEYWIRKTKKGGD